MSAASDDEAVVHGKKKRVATASVIGTKYDLVARSIEEAGLQCRYTVDAAKSAFLIWSDAIVQLEIFQELKNYQRINHFPGMGAICRKDCLAKNMSKIAQSMPDEFDFVPETWVLPAEYNLLHNHFKERKRKGKKSTFIAKPQNGAMGNGIHLFRNPTQLPPNENLIVQEYLDQPYILDGYKIDLRIYVLVTHCDPLKAFIYRDGLVRLGTEKYTSPSNDNMSSSFMHLTNYSVNKRNKNFERHDGADQGSKRSIQSFLSYLKSVGCNTGLLWRQITNVVVKTLIVASPFLLHNYRVSRPGQQPSSDSVCFEILGFDILLDRKLKPWLLEVNRSPSFSADENVDMEIKSGVLMDALQLINIRHGDKVRHMTKQKADSQRRLFKQRNEAKKFIGNKRDIILSKRKEDLQDQLSWAKLNAAREEHETHHMNNYSQLFPSYETHLQNKYLDLLKESFRIFFPNASRTHQNQLLDLHKYHSESDIVSMIKEVDAEIKTNNKSQKSGSPTKFQRPGSSIPVRPKIPTTLYEDKAWQHEYSRPSTATQRIRSAALFDLEPKFSQPRARTQSPVRDGYDLPLMRDPYPTYLNEDAADIASEISQLLEDLKLRFPGKTNAETTNMLEYMTENWSMQKSQIASYWLVKLDSTKREKVIDIVRHNVNRVIQCKELSSDFQYNKITSLINRIFNIMLSCHGHGLWGCFTTPQESWEKSLKRGKRNMTKVDLAISQRIVNLCKDCVLIVYRFTHDIDWQPMKLKAPYSGDGPEKYDGKLPYTPRPSPFHRHTNYYSSDSVVQPAPYGKHWNWHRKNYQ